MKHIAQALEVETLFKKLEETKPELAAKCREAFRQGRDSALNASETENSPISNTSSDPDSQSRRRASLPDMATLVPKDSPVRLEAAVPDFIPVILRIGQATGHIVAKERLQLIAGALVKANWTLAELELAEPLILTDAELTREISYERTVGPGVFAQAKTRTEVARGRLFTFEDAKAWCESHAPSRQEARPVSQVFMAVRFKENPEEVRWMLR